MKPKKPLTDRAIRSLKATDAGKRRIVWDALIPGFGIRITDRGVKSFVLVTRYPGSNSPAPRSLGTYPMIGLEAARTKAREWLSLIGNGTDPTQHLIRKRQETFQAISAEYFARKAKDHRSRGLNEATMARLVYPAFGPRPIAAISRSDIVRLLDRIEDERGPIMANRTLGIISRVMGFYASRSDDFRSPIIKGMSRGAEQARSRILSDDELRTVWRACGDYPGFGPMLRFILLTATRRTEAAEMTWAELADGTWIIPAARYKTKHDHVVPLSPLAQSMLPERQNGELVWTRNGRTPMSNYDYHKQAIDRLSGATNWVIHDLRRTARSLLSRAGVATDHAERCLGHVIGGVRGVYDRHEYFEEKARAFEALAAQVERIIHPPAEGKVVAMRPKR